MLGERVERFEMCDPVAGGVTVVDGEGRERVERRWRRVGSEPVGTDRETSYCIRFDTSCFTLCCTTKSAHPACEARSSRKRN